MHHAGTGKTTVARLVAKILNDCNLRPRDTIIETTAQEVKDKGADEFRKSVASALGGCLFIDEAYDLNPVGDLSGKPIVNELLTMAEDKRDEISFILAGYEDDFEKKFFAYNEGLKSRFKTMVFEDFDESELTTIWKHMREDKEWREEEDVGRVVVKRMAKMAGRKGFGNAREVRRRLEEATQSAMSRLGSTFDESTMVLTIEDVIGQDPKLLNEKLKRVMLEIDEKIGWRRVKEQAKELVNICGVNYCRELRGKPPLDIFLNRLFLGNPGMTDGHCCLRDISNSIH
jgi:replication-associated recombination protein RarA